MQLPLFSEPLAPPRLALDIAFHSGMSAPADLRGGIDAGKPIGVVAGNLNTAAKVMGIPKYLDAGGKVFVDSGCFTAFRTGEPMNWPAVMTVYETLVNICDHPENLWIVAPDKIGDQIATMALLAEWRPRLLSLMDSGCHVIVPLQCGELPAQVMVERIGELFGRRDWVAGVPSNKAAMSVKECATLRHRAFHILGRVALNPEQVERIQALRGGNPDCKLTADANWLRSRLGLVQRQPADPGRNKLGQCARASAVRRALLADDRWSVAA